MSIGDKIRRFLATRKKYRLWQRIVSGMGIVVVFITTYMLILPAITMERPTYCGIEEHSHTKECYLACQESDALAPPDFNCAGLTAYIHTHNDDCYFNGELVCPLEEIENHVHTDECFKEEKRLICGLEESQGHTHSEDCYSEEKILICENEDPEHEHDDSCYDVIRDLTCTLEEGEGHTHDESCYETVRTIECTAAEAHIHGGNCYDADGNLICNLAEAQEHIHSSSCMTKAAPADHVHTDACYGTEPTCGKQEHEHTDACYVDPNEKTEENGGSGSDEPAEEPDEDDDHMGYDDEFVSDDVVSPNAIVGPTFEDLAAPTEADGSTKYSTPKDFGKDNVEVLEAGGSVHEEPGYHLVAKIENVDTDGNVTTPNADDMTAIKKALGIDKDDFYNDGGLLIADIYYEKDDDTNQKRSLPNGAEVNVWLDVQGAAGERYLRVISMDRDVTEEDVLPSDIETLSGTLVADWYDMIKNFHFTAPASTDTNRYCFVSTKVFGGYVEAVNYYKDPTGGTQAIVDGTANVWDSESAAMDAAGNLKPVTEDTKAGFDKNNNNYIVRTFDNIQYNLDFDLRNRGIMTPSEIESLKVEFTLDKDISQAVFNISDMSWLTDWRVDYYNEDDDLVMYENADGKFRKQVKGYDDNRNLNFDTDVSTKEKDENDFIKTDYNEMIRAYQKTASTTVSSYDSGIRKQVLTGYTEVALPGNQNRTAGIKVLACANNESIAPEFNAYFEGNPDNLCNEVIDTPKTDKMEDIFQKPEPKNASLKTAEKGVDDEHKNGIVKVTAAPRYKFNIQSNDNLSYKANFDLATGNESRNPTATSVYGRMVGYGVTLTLLNQTSEGLDVKKKGIMGIELPTGDITLNFNVETKDNDGSGGGFSTLSLGFFDSPVMRLNSAINDIMFSEIVLNEGSDMISVFNSGDMSSDPIGYDEEGNAIALEDDDNASLEQAEDNSIEAYDENNGESVSSDEGDTAPSYNIDENNDDTDENNAFVSDDEGDTFFEEVAADDTEYMAGNVNSINDTVEMALFDNEFYDLMASTNYGSDVGINYTFTEDANGGTRTWDFTGISEDKTLQEGDTIEGGILMGNPSPSLSSNYKFYPSQNNKFYIEVPNNAVSCKLSMWTSRSDGTGASYTATVTNVGDCILYNANSSSAKPLEIDSSKLQGALIPKNGKNYLEITAKGSLRTTKISLNYTISGTTGGDETSSTTTTVEEPTSESTTAAPVGDRKIGSHSKTDDKEEWRFDEAANMPASSSENVYLSEGDDINGIKVGLYAVIRHAPSTDEVSLRINSSAAKDEADPIPDVPEGEKSIKIPAGSNASKLSFKSLKGTATIGSETYATGEHKDIDITSLISSGYVTISNKGSGDLDITYITVTYSSTPGGDTDAEQDLTDYSNKRGTHTKSSKAEVWGFTDNMPDSGTSISISASSLDINGLTYTNTNSSNKNGGQFNSKDEATSYFKFKSGNKLDIPIRPGADTLIITLYNTSKTISVNEGKGTITQSDNEYKITADDIANGKITISPSGDTQITEIRVTYSAAGAGQYEEPSSDNAYTAKWTFNGEGVPAADVTLDNSTNLNNITYEGTGSSSYKAGGYIELAADDKLKVPVEAGYTGGKVTVTTESGSVTTDHDIFFNKNNISFVTITADETAQITAISIAYDIPEGVNYGTYDAENDTWNFNTDDIPKNAGKAYLSDGDLLEGKMTFNGGNDSYFEFVGASAGTLYLASGDTLNVPVDKTMSGGQISVSFDGGSLSSTVGAVTSDLVTSNLTFSTKGTITSIPITANGEVKINTITVKYDSYDEGINYGKYKSTSDGDSITRTWSFTEDMPEMAEAYILNNTKLEGNNIIYTGGGEAFFGVSPSDNQLHLKSGDKLTITLPKNITGGTLTITPNDGLSISPSEIKAGTESVVITATGDAAITKISVNYTLDSSSTSKDIVDANVYLVYRNSTSAKEINTYIPADGMDSILKVAYSDKTNNVFTLKNSSGVDVTSTFARSGNITGSYTIEGLVDLTFHARGSASNHKLTVTVPSSGSSAKLYVFGSASGGSSTTSFALSDTGTNKVYTNSSELHSFKGTALQTDIFSNLEPNHTYELSIGDSAYIAGFALVNSTNPADKSVWMTDPNTPATEGTARIYVYLPQIAAAAANVYSASLLDGVYNNEVHTQYKDDPTGGLNIFGQIIPTETDTSTGLSYSGKITDYANIDIKKTLEKSDSSITFTVPTGYNARFTEAKSATLYMITSSTAKSTETTEYRHIKLTGGTTYSGKKQEWDISGSDQGTLRPLVYKSLVPGEKYTITIDAPELVHTSGQAPNKITNMRHGAFILVLSPNYPVATDWQEDADPPKESKVPIKGGETKHIPFLWDYDPNYQPDDNGSWERNLDWDADGWRTNSARNAAPYNNGWENRNEAELPNYSYPEVEVTAIYGTEEYEIHWGGKWFVPKTENGINYYTTSPSAAKNGNNPDVAGVSTYPVTVNEYEFDFENMHFPTNFGGHSMGSKDFSSKGFGTSNAAYSAGYFEVIVPFDTNKSDTVTVRGFVRDFKAKSLGGTDVTQAGIGNGTTSTDNENYEVGNGEDQAKDNITGSESGDLNIIKYNSFMAKGATNINDKDITEATRNDPSKRDSTNNIKGQFLGNSWSTSGQDWDASASKGDKIDVWGGYQLSAPSDNFVTASNLTQKFDSAVLTIDETDPAYSSSSGDFNEQQLIGRTWSEIIKPKAETLGLSPKVNLLWGVSTTESIKTGGFNSTGTISTGSSTPSGGNMSDLKTDSESDFTWYDTYKAAKATGNKISAVMAEMRDGYIVNGCYFGFRIPVVVSDDCITGRDYATANILEAWSYVEGANMQPMRDISWLNINAADEYGNTYKKLNSAKLGYFNTGSEYYDSADQDQTQITHTNRKATNNTDGNDNNFVVTKYWECTKPGHIGDTENNILKQNRGKYKTEVKTAYTAGMGLLVTDYKSQVKIAVDNGSNLINNVPYYDKSSGASPKYRLYGIRTFTNSTAVRGNNTNLTMDVDLTKLTGNLLKDKGGVYISSDKLPKLEFRDADGNVVGSVDITAYNEKQTIRIPDGAVGAGETFNLTVEFAAGDEGYTKARTITFKYENAPHNIDLGEVILNTEMSAVAEGNTLVTAKTTITGTGDMRNFADYSLNQDSVDIGISAIGGTDNHKYAHIIDKPSDNVYGEAQYFNDMSEQLLYPEQNQEIVYMLAYSNVSGSNDVNVVYAYDILSNILNDNGHVNVKSVKVFTSSADDRGVSVEYPKYDVYFTDEADATIIANVWGNKDDPEIPGVKTSTVAVGTKISAGGDESKAVHTFSGGDGDNHTGIYFAVSPDDPDIAVGAGRMLYIQLVCEPVAAEGKTLTDTTIGRQYTNTAYFITKAADGRYTDPSAGATDVARIAPVGRNISGVVWLDANGDGRRQTAESDRIENVKVALFVKDTANNKYIKVTEDINKKPLGNGTSNDGIYTTGADGTYAFNNLPAGDYVVAFSYDGVAFISPHQPGSATATLSQRRTNNTNDSVATEDLTEYKADFEGYDFITKYEYNANDKNAIVSAIPLESAADVVAHNKASYVQNAAYWDLGIMQGGDPLPSTGGMGTDGIKYAGIAIVCGAALMLMWDNKRRLRK